MTSLLDRLRERYPHLDLAWQEYCSDGPADPVVFLDRLRHTADPDATFLDQGPAPSPMPDRFIDRDRPSVGVPHDVPGRGLQIGDVLGTGAMGEVRDALDLDLHRTVAWKVMSTRAATRSELSSAFWCEAQITSQLDHPHIVPIHGLTRASDGRLAYTMRKIEGHTLREWMQLCRQHPTEETYALPRRLEVFLKICDALQFAHDRGVVHRDLKPSNIMLGTHGEVYVMDWGIAALTGPSTGRETPTVEGYSESTLGSTDRRKAVVIGTPGYMSPEQARWGSPTSTARATSTRWGWSYRNSSLFSPRYEARTSVSSWHGTSEGRSTG